jgi:UMF1 family MFS transporter
MTDPTGDAAAAPASVPTPPPTANTGAVSAYGRELTPEKKVPRKQVLSWAMWDWATQPFNTTILTFVWVALYLTSWQFLDPALAAQGVLADGTRMSCVSAEYIDSAYCGGLADLSAWWGWANFAAGILILLLAPVLGQQADARGNKKKWLVGATLTLALIQFVLFFIEADPAYFWWGAFAVALGAVVNEIGGVNYNAMLVEVSTRATIGRVSGLGWGFGYLGGVVSLLLCVPLVLGLSGDPLAYKLVALICGAWTIVFAIPLFLNVPEAPAPPGAPRAGLFSSYKVLALDLVKLFRTSRPTFWFLLASAVYRDGLAGVFAFGAVLAAQGFGFTTIEVMIFGLAANVVAGVSTLIAGRFDDLFGSRAVIVTALSGLVAMAVFVFFARDLGTIVFWIGGLVLSAFVGPAQASSRGLLARVTPAGMQGEIFGLYATTGRVASFLSPAAWALFIGAFGAIIYGVLGIGLILLVGLVLLLLVRLPKHVRA